MYDRSINVHSLLANGDPEDSGTRPDEREY